MRLEHKDHSVTAEELFDKLWRQEHLRHCLSMVKNEVEETTFRAFVAYVMEEEPVRRVCEQFDMTAGQVYAIKSRMMKRIRQGMMEILGTEE